VRTIAKDKIFQYFIKYLISERNALKYLHKEFLESYAFNKEKYENEMLAQEEVNNAKNGEK
jgi:hypothetical protein